MKNAASSSTTITQLERKLAAADAENARLLALMEKKKPNGKPPSNRCMNSSGWPWSIGSALPLRSIRWSRKTCLLTKPKWRLMRKMVIPTQRTTMPLMKLTPLRRRNVVKGVAGWHCPLNSHGLRWFMNCLNRPATVRTMAPHSRSSAKRLAKNFTWYPPGSR